MQDQVKDEKIQTQFSISYDAKGDLANHEIDAKVLGTAILGMDELVKSAARVVSNGSAEASLKVLAPAQEGSLSVLFAILADPVTTKTILASVGIATTSLAAGAATAISVIQKIKDKKIDKITVDTKAGTAVLEVGEEKIEAPEKVARLVSDKEFRNALFKVIKAPVSHLDDAKVKFLTADEAVTLELAPEEIKSFEPLKTGSLEEVTETTNQVVVSFTILNFKGKRGWSIQTREGLEASVTIEDELFMEKVSANEEAFQKDKLYTVELKHAIIKTPTTERNKYTIIRVINEFSAD